ncbi:hypothetical protein ACOME3_009584 [Neoechinorhynchus agilis]
MELSYKKIKSGDLDQVLLDLTIDDNSGLYQKVEGIEKLYEFINACSESSLTAVEIEKCFIRIRDLTQDKIVLLSPALQVLTRLTELSNCRRSTKNSIFQVLISRFEMKCLVIRDQTRLLLTFLRNIPDFRDLFKECHLVENLISHVPYERNPGVLKSILEILYELIDPSEPPCNLLESLEPFIPVKVVGDSKVECDTIRRLVVQCLAQCSNYLEALEIVRRDEGSLGMIYFLISTKNKSRIGQIESFKLRKMMSDALSDERIPKNVLHLLGSIVAQSRESVRLNVQADILDGIDHELQLTDKHLRAVSEILGGSP